MVLRYQSLIEEKGESSPEAWTYACELLADGCDNPQRTPEEWDREPAEAVKAIEELMETATAGFEDSEGN